MRGKNFQLNSFAPFENDSAANRAHRHAAAQSEHRLRRRPSCV